MCNTTKETKEFFMFSYFGILPKGIFKEKKNNGEFSEFQKYEDYVAYKCSYRAYLDVCRTIKYSVSSTIIYKNKDSIKKYDGYIKLKEAFINYEINLILENLESLLTKDNYDTEHNSLCTKMLFKNNNEVESKLLDNIKDGEYKNKTSKAFKDFYLFKTNEELDEVFKYGMAQKWLNMTIKNLLLAEDMFNGCTGYGNILKENRAKFHVPVDKNILNAAKSLGINKILGKTYSIEGWSNWEEPTYTEFIRLLKDKLQKTSMLDWEHSAWMEYAE
ncbi:MAG: hypothetical protein IJ275_04340 [Ruminococcus sp.]|nr:hypothetical protein [Ruminococcus sp.]